MPSQSGMSEKALAAWRELRIEYCFNDSGFFACLEIVISNMDTDTTQTWCEITLQTSSRAIPYIKELIYHSLNYYIRCYIEMVQSFIQYYREHDTVTSTVPYKICI
jgi:hypothetical protein